MIDQLSQSTDPTKEPFNTSAIDLTLSDEIVVPKLSKNIVLNLKESGIANLIDMNSKLLTISDEQPYVLKRNLFVLAKTREKVSFPLFPKKKCYSTRVEGRSSIARCGVLVHFTAPTIHAGFNGTITLEIINLGPADFNLFPGMKICQLIIEEVKGVPRNAPNQFKGQSRAVGVPEQTRFGQK